MNFSTKFRAFSWISKTLIIMAAVSTATAASAWITPRDACYKKCLEDEPKATAKCLSDHPVPPRSNIQKRADCIAAAKAAASQCKDKCIADFPDEGTCDNFQCWGTCVDGKNAGSTCHEARQGSGPIANEGRDCLVNGCAGKLQCVDMHPVPGTSTNRCGVDAPKPPLPTGLPETL